MERKSERTASGCTDSVYSQMSSSNSLRMRLYSSAQLVSSLEAVILDRIRRQLPVFLAQLDQALRQPDRVLEVDVDVDHAVADQQRALRARRRSRSASSACRRSASVCGLLRMLDV